MSEQSTSKALLSKVLELRGKPAQEPVVMTREQQEEQAFLGGWQALKDARNQRDEERAAREAVQRDFELLKKDSAAEHHAQRTEYEAKLANATASLRARETQVQELGAEKEKYQKRCYELEGMIDGLGKAFATAVQTIKDQGVHLKAGLLKTTSNVTSMLGDDIAHLHDGLTSTIRNQSEDLARRIAELRKHGEQIGYRPSGPRPEKPQIPELTLQDLETVQKFAPAKEPEK